jgi:lysophospholipase L1-like esterase
MAAAQKESYLSEVCDDLARLWPDNHTVNIVCHGHSVPAGYFATPYVNTFRAYPHLLHRHIKERFPYGVVNVIVTAIGGENSQQGAERFAADVLCHKPQVLTIDYGLNDRFIGPEKAEAAWRFMIEAALKEGVKVILLTPSWDQSYFSENEDWRKLLLHRDTIRALAVEYGIGLADTFAAFQRYIENDGELADLLSHINHPGYKGHALIAGLIAGWFLAR